MDRFEESRAPARPSNSVNGWLVAVLLVAVAFLFVREFERRPGALHNPDAKPRLVEARGDLAPLETSTIELFRNASPSVVHIISSVAARNRLNLDLEQIPRGSGSGFVWDRDGHIVTNLHVISGAQFARVTLGDGTSWSARLVGADPSSDLAVLKIDAKSDQLQPIPVGTSTDLQVGQSVFAIGNPFSLDQTLTTGVIGGLGREITAENRETPISNVIQTDAAINPGNSGGPLLDSAGRLIGVNTAIYSPSGAYAGVGFAVPVDTVNRVVPQLIATGRVEQPGLGITLFPDNFVERMLEQGTIDRSGVLIQQVTEGSAAEKAGLRSSRQLGDGGIEWGDLIVAIDDARVEDSVALQKILGNHSVGDKVVVTYLREGEEHRVEATLQALNHVAQ